MQLDTHRWLSHHTHRHPLPALLLLKPHGLHDWRFVGLFNGAVVVAPEEGGVSDGRVLRRGDGGHERYVPLN